MTDDKAAENQVDHQSFSWWVCMAPFLVACGIFAFLWSKHQSDIHYMGWAVASLLAGIILACIVDACGDGGTSADDGAGGS